MDMEEYDDELSIIVSGSIDWEYESWGDRLNETYPFDDDCDPFLIDHNRPGEA